MTYEQFTMQTVGPAGASAPSREGDPSKDFITVGRREHDRKSFEASVSRMRQAEGNNVVVFVHGYNYSYQEAVFRLAQLKAEAGAHAVPVLFSWPSQADFRGYVADRDSTTYARDDLVQLLTMLSRSRSGGRVTVVGHSMGAWLVMEALRQLRLQGRGDVIARLQVGLASPDIDVDVFRKQVAIVGRLSPPLTVLVSNDDRALAVSSRITGGKPRLGAAKVDDPEIQKIAALNGVQIIDISTLPSNDAFNHDRFVTFAARYSTAERDRTAGGFRQAGVFLLDTTGRILSAPFNGTAQIIAGAQ
ncbi:alpha/beta hydrolase [Shinella pollutisoli]|uniref:Alpha/beta hydrolase n=1 Tax=Shinella pollutisoli TaxID=2250594 RepID=A0ABV7DAD3_9HYPH|nr:alpha/beta fold hydrolase [Shinella pollutisoli]